MARPRSHLKLSLFRPSSTHGPPPRLTLPRPTPCSTQPLPEGETRKWEDWEKMWVPGMTLAFVLYGVAYYNRPFHEDEWARAQALKRMAAKEAEAGGEEEEEE